MYIWVPLFYVCVGIFLFSCNIRKLNPYIYTHTLTNIYIYIFFLTFFQRYFAKLPTIFTNLITPFTTFFSNLHFFSYLMPLSKKKIKMHYHKTFNGIYKSYNAIYKFHNTIYNIFWRFTPFISFMS